jgi:hypothetical protein
MTAFNLLGGWSLAAIAVTNAVLAWVAAVVHMWAASRTSGLLQKMFIGIASLAFFYSLAYWWLAFNTDRSADWSNFLRPFGVLTWVIAWSVEPLILVTYLNRRGEEIVGKAYTVAEKAKGKLDESE